MWTRPAALILPATLSVPFGNTDAFVGLPWGGIIALILTVIYLVARKVITFQQAMECVPKGFIAMISPILILTLAVSLKAMINSLGAAEYVRDLMVYASDFLYGMLPAVIFLVACVLAFASGTSWGTFGILIPVVTAVFPDGQPSSHHRHLRLLRGRGSAATTARPSRIPRSWRPPARSATT